MCIQGRLDSFNTHSVFLITTAKQGVSDLSRTDFFEIFVSRLREKDNPFGGAVRIFATVSFLLSFLSTISDYFLCRCFQFPLDLVEN